MTQETRGDVGPWIKLNNSYVVGLEALQLPDLVVDDLFLHLVELIDQRVIIEVVSACFPHLFHCVEWALLCNPPLCIVDLIKLFSKIVSVSNPS